MSSPELGARQVLTQALARQHRALERKNPGPRPTLGAEEQAAAHRPALSRAPEVQGRVPTLQRHYEELPGRARRVPAPWRRLALYTMLSEAGACGLWVEERSSGSMGSPCLSA